MTTMQVGSVEAVATPVLPDIKTNLLIQNFVEPNLQLYYYIAPNHEYL